MSVLVEALSLVVPRKVLDVSYPGGADSFVQHMSEPDASCRCVCADDKLVSASFIDSSAAAALAHKLTDLGMIQVDDHQFVEFAFVDQAVGPTMPCGWLEWKRHEDGYTTCWVAGSDPDALQVPENWTPEHSRRLTRTDIRDEPGRCVQLSDENGLEIWLDFQTGQMIEGLPQRPASDSASADAAAQLPAVGATMPATEGFDAEDRLIATVRSAFDHRGYKYQQIGESTLTLISRRESASYMIMFRSNPKLDWLGLVASYGSNVPAFRRVAIAEAASRANMRLSLGNFELDFDDGELRFRAGVDVEGGVLSERMVENMLGAAIAALERFHEAFMQVAFGGADPKATLQQC
jgi:hypothetical protein